MPLFGTNQLHASLHTSHDSGFDSSNYGAYHMSAPSYLANQSNLGYQPSYGPAPDSSTFEAYNTAALAPNSAFDQQLILQDPGLAQLGDVSAMQLPDTAAAVPYSTANEKSIFSPTETLEFQGWDQSGFASHPTGTSSLPAAYDPHRADSWSWLDSGSQLAAVDPALAHDLGCMTTCSASSSLGALTE